MDYWLIQLNELGNILWNKTYGGNTIDDLIALQQTSDNGFILGGNSASDLSGTKTEISEGFTDYWIIKLAPICEPTPEICNIIDDNCNGLIDDGITETISISPKLSNFIIQ